MIWSRVKKELESLFSSALQKRVDVHVTTYARGWDHTELYNRGWITVDGVEVVNFATPDAYFMHRSDYNASTPGLEGWTLPDKPYESRTPGALVEKGEFSKYDLSKCCYEYLSMSIEEALQHTSPIIRSFAFLDQRTGKRTLAAVNRNELHPLERYFYDLRVQSQR